MYFACNSIFAFHILTKHLKIPIFTILNIKNGKKKDLKISNRVKVPLKLLSLSKQLIMSQTIDIVFNIERYIFWTCTVKDRDVRVPTCSYSRFHV